jgi:hypothetical protein
MAFEPTIHGQSRDRHGIVVRNLRDGDGSPQPLTAPEVMPRMKNRWSERNTMIGTMIVM